MSRSNETYNGWTNYATWRVHLEMFDGMEVDERDRLELFQWDIGINKAQDEEDPDPYAGSEWAGGQECNPK